MIDRQVSMHVLPFSSTRPIDWLLETKTKVPFGIADQLKNGLFSSLPIFLGGVLNATAVAAIAAWRHPTAAFIGWLLFEIILGLVRMAVLIQGKKRLAAGQLPPRAVSALLSCMWALSVGLGTSLCILSGDWILATIACLSAAAMVSGICMRNFGTPRLATTMVLLALGPCAISGMLTREPILPIISVQLPIFMLTIFSASFALHKMLVSWMIALTDLERSESLTETILRSSPDHMLILDKDYHVIFYNRQRDGSEEGGLVGKNWLAGIAEEDRGTAQAALESAKAGQSAVLSLGLATDPGKRLWFDIAINQTSDASGRLIVVARDITHQKKSEEKAIWMAQHDALTGLPNRTLLQQHLDETLADVGRDMAAAMLIVDVDNFKAINDTVGHDGGDALLCAFAERLRAAVAEGDLVARTGGDEFALVIGARSEKAVERIAQNIFDQLRVPIDHGGRLLECGASIGASLIPRDGTTRSEIMKAADIALYAAKTGGRAQLRIFEPGMMIEVERHQTMIALARQALIHDAIIPHYQPKIDLRRSEVVGFEALLRWKDHDGQLRTPDMLSAAFDDPALGSLLSERMLQKVLDDIQHWSRTGVPFGHVAINVAGADFRHGGFAGKVIGNLAARKLPANCIQIEVTENVFLGHGASDVERELRMLSDYGIRIALDDFGTGYASLSHLTQFPVNLLKIDRSFIQNIGISADAEAITSTVVNLGHCLGLEIVAEGIETPAQEAYLREMRCDVGQGFLYARAMPAKAVSAWLDNFNASDQIAIAS
ncbi:EAL domain-containing protein [Sphingobium sp. AP49]|uniref:putative bifunctional diguanylate cyclase/phosphodiesterase n=1 Tax=Sphingobium sp. AP49 TaxID=1144307 RepID=UPI00026EE33D|nr:EAL domain-containing protein [Sphingobium sp. AP49]WHO37976.1 EAL domain-containing protein [Sphingobium sp. AP49]